jgi:sigma-B regulation protein RsbU (phosphoserine phosphatase)
MFDDSQYDQVILGLETGDVFVFHTDGVSDSRRGNEEYGVSRLAETVKRHARQSATELGDAIMADVETFTGDAIRADDVTLVVVKVL